MKIDLDSNSENGKSFLRLKAGESVIGVFRGDSFKFYQHWLEFQSSVCPGANLCNYCDGTETTRPTVRYRINFVLKENGSYTCKIFEQGKKVFEQIKQLLDDGYDLEKTLVKITRFGSTKKDTKYTITPLPNGTISPEGQKQLSEMKLFNLAPKSESDSESGSSSSDDVPF